MKKLILVIIVFASCKKEKPDVSLTSIKVEESVTNLPVIGASLVLFRCNLGCPLGIGYTEFFNGVTDNNGTCQVQSEHYADARSEMNVWKEKYWPFLVQKNTVVYITPEGWLRLRIHRVNNYPVGSTLLLNVVSQAGTEMDLTSYNTAADSSILVKAFGSQKNKIDGQVVDANHNLLAYGTIEDLQIPRFDTLKNVTLNY